MGRGRGGGGRAGRPVGGMTDVETARQRYRDLQAGRLSRPASEVAQAVNDDLRSMEVEMTGLDIARNGEFTLSVRDIPTDRDAVRQVSMTALRQNYNGNRPSLEVETFDNGQIHYMGRIPGPRVNLLPSRR